MFVFNLNISKAKIVKAIILFFAIIAICILIVSIINLLKNLTNTNTTNNILKSSCEINNDIAIIDSKNYTNVLKAVHEDLDRYMGQKISFTRICL